MAGESLGARAIDVTDRGQDGVRRLVDRGRVQATHGAASDHTHPDRIVRRRDDRGHPRGFLLPSSRGPVAARWTARRIPDQGPTPPTEVDRPGPGSVSATGTSSWRYPAHNIPKGRGRH